LSSSLSPRHPARASTAGMSRTCLKYFMRRLLLFLAGRLEGIERH